MNTKNGLIGRLIVLAILGISAIVSVSVYTLRNNAFKPATTTATAISQIANPEVIQNWIPSTAYAAMQARVSDYISNNNLKVTTIALKGGITFDPDTYDFDLALQPANQTIGVTVRVSNFSSILSNAILINGQLQTQTLKYSQTAAPLPQPMKALIPWSIEALAPRKLMSYRKRFISSRLIQRTSPSILQV
jgi:hypothetical protein